MPNMYKPPFNDINVRRAMQMALDNETAATLWKGFADPTPYGRVGIPGFYIPFEQWDEEVKQYYRYDPEAAEKLLDEAGYPRGADGRRFKTTLNHGSQYGNLDYAEVAVSYWAEIGVEVEIELLTGAEMNEKLGGPNLDGPVDYHCGQRIRPCPGGRLVSHGRGTVGGDHASSRVA